MVDSVLSDYQNLPRTRCSPLNRVVKLSVNTNRGTESVLVDSSVDENRSPVDFREFHDKIEEHISVSYR